MSLEAKGLRHLACAILLSLPAALALAQWRTPSPQEQAQVMAVLEKATGMPLPEYAREQLVVPLGLGEPSYQHGLRMRTEGMGKLGQLFLQNGVWGDRQLLAKSYVADATVAQNPGGPPGFLPYGYMWWVVPSKTQRQTFMASGYSGQFIWVYPGLDMVIATTAIVSADAQRRGQALQLIRGPLFDAARKQ